MKRAVSISIGSFKRDKCLEMELLGESVRIERIGTDGDMQRATDLFNELDGEVDASGVGGTNMMEAALIAVSGKRRALREDELQDMIGRIGLQPQLQILN